MTTLHNNILTEHTVVRADEDRDTTMAAVLRTALDLLASLPDRPQRLRVGAADVMVDLDWRALPQPSAPAPAALPAPAAAPVPVAAAAPEPPAAAPAADPRTHFVSAPTVGTFYHSPEPGAAPFVTVGTVVSPGQQVGIVEAMKLMLPVEAGQAGRVVAVLVPDGQAVEYGEPLLELGPVDAG